MRSDRLNRANARSIERGCDLQGRGRVRARLFSIVAPQSCKRLKLQYNTLMSEVAEVSNRPVGRPRLELTEEQIEKLKLMAPYLTIEMMADSLQVNRSTFQEILKRDPVISGIYQAHKSDKVAQVASSLVGKALDGDTRAAMFYLRTQGRWREEGHTASERPQIQINVSGINDIKTEKVIEGEVLDESTAIRPAD